MKGGIGRVELNSIWIVTNITSTCCIYKEIGATDRSKISSDSIPACTHIHFSRTFPLTCSRPDLQWFPPLSEQNCDFSICYILTIFYLCCIHPHLIFFREITSQVIGFQKEDRDFFLL